MQGLRPSAARHDRLVITPSLDRAWIRPLASLRPRGVGIAVCHLDPIAYAAIGRGQVGAADASAAAERASELRVLRHALAEYDLQVHEIVPGRRLAELLVAPGAASTRRV